MNAACLGASLADQHPGKEFTVAVLASELGDLTLPGATLVTPSDLGIDGLEQVASRLGMPSLRRALIGPVVSRLLERDDSITYLDPYLVALAPLTRLEAFLEDDEIVLVQHSTATSAEDQTAGTLHAGLLAVRGGATTDSLLSEWPQTVPRAKKHDGRGVRDYFHSWFDSIPGRFDAVKVSHSPGYVVAACHVERDAFDLDGNLLRWRGEPVTLLDLSEVRSPDERPASAVGNSPADGRTPINEVPELIGLVNEISARAKAILPAAPRLRSFDRLPDGTTLDARLRRLAGEAIDSEALSGSIFTDAGAADFYEWLNQPAHEGAKAGLTRYHYAIWEEISDLHTAYPDLDGEDGDNFAIWLNLHRWPAIPMPSRLLPPKKEDGRETPLSYHRDPVWGVNVAGYFTSELGLGEAARLLIRGLDAGGVRALPVRGTYVPPCDEETEFKFANPSQAPFAINIICMNGDVIPSFAREAGEGFFRGRYTIALWWWETNTFPDHWREAYDFIDEVWVASDLVHDAIAPTSPVPVNKIPLPVSLPVTVVPSRSELGMPDGFVFLFVFDYHSTSARKNPQGTIKAFRETFPPGSGASLVIKTINAANCGWEQQQVLAAADGHPDIHFIDGYVAAATKNAMLASCDCYVSLHRSEGFGLTPAEAMWFGRPVIATGYGGVLEFMRPSNSYLVDCETVRVGPGADPYPPDGVWAEPDLAEASALMRRVFDNPIEAREKGEQAATDIRRFNSPEASGAAIAARLRGVYDRLLTLTAS